MSSVLNMLGLQGDSGYNFLIILPVVAIVVVIFVLKLSSGKSGDTNKSKAKSVKKQPKITTNKQNEEKLYSDKHGNEKNTSPSTAKALEGVAIDTVKSKPNRNQTNSNEKPPKKTVQSKKQQVKDNNVNNSAKNPPTKKQTNNKKQLESFVSTEEEGEWQMVTTKKKKQSKLDEVIESTTPSKSDKKPQKTTKKTSKTEKVKVANEKNYVPVTVVNGDVTPTEISQVAKSEPSVEGQTKEIPVLSTNSTILQESPIPKPFTSNTITSVDAAEVNDINVLSISSANVAFDELGGKLKFLFSIYINS